LIKTMSGVHKPIEAGAAAQNIQLQAGAEGLASLLVAGFRDVSFMYEPEAAALASGPLDKGVLGLIVDIGGGTSDFSIFERDGDATRIIASHGVRVGGTDFDRSISIAEVMPLLGRGAEVRNTLGSGRHVAPNAIFNDLATWQKIPFVYTAEYRRMAKDFVKLGIDPTLFVRLKTVLEMELGHDIAFAVEAGKIQINKPDVMHAGIDLRTIEAELWARFTKAAMSEVLADHAAQIRTCAAETLEMANISSNQIGKVVFVGGSSLLHVVEDVMISMFPDAALERAEAFTAVADGLAIAAAT
jgi:hypothetical chaperone protein